MRRALRKAAIWTRRAEGWRDFLRANGVRFSHHMVPETVGEHVEVPSPIKATKLEHRGIIS